MILEVRDIHTYYGTSHILQGVSLNIDKGEGVCLLGRNGAGKSTTFKSIVGLLSPKKGSITFKGNEIIRKQPFRIARLGIGYVPEDRRIYPDLTVRENLKVGLKTGKNQKDSWTIEKIYDIFPLLKPMENRKGSQMSGGEQQMLTIARSLMGNPELLLLDEPSEGLAPIVVADVGRLIERIREEGVSVLIAEQNSMFSLKLVDRAYVIENGVIEWQGSVNEISDDESLRNRYLSV
jgi:branched-chain amino acid transport system ATP-binding protein